MAQQQRRFNRRDEVYLSSPGFEPYMIAGMVFIVIFTAIFIISLKISLEILVWPGLALAAASCFITLKWLERREYARKLAEIEAEQDRSVTRP